MTIFNFKTWIPIAALSLLALGCHGEVKPTKYTPGVEVDIGTKAPDLDTKTDDDIRVDVKKPLNDEAPKSSLPPEASTPPAPPLNTLDPMPMN